MIDYDDRATQEIALGILTGFQSPTIDVGTSTFTDLKNDYGCPFGEIIIRLSRTVVMVYIYLYICRVEYIDHFLIEGRWVITA